MNTFVAGGPKLFLTSPRAERAWTKQVRAAVQLPLVRPRLTFVVGSYLRRGQPFDTDNLGKLVLDAVAPQPETVWITVTEGQPAGVWISEAVPPPAPEAIRDLRLERPPTRSLRRLDVLTELREAELILPLTSLLGLYLAFDGDAVPIGRLDFSGPIKPLMDALGPILADTRHGPADHRVKDLRISRGHRPGGGGVDVRVWPLGSRPLSD